MKRNKYVFGTIIMVVLVTLNITSCSKDDIKGENGSSFPPKKTIVIETKSYETWTYFSFEKGVIGTYKEGEFNYKNNTTWDIAFHRWDVRTNSGESGIGKGGAFLTNYGGDLKVDMWSTMPSKGEFITDASIKTYMAIPNMNSEDGADQRVIVPANTILAKWLTVVMTSIPPKYALLNKAFVVRTANGKHAAISFTNYMNDKAVKGYVNFDYIYPLD
ncbi:MAG: HmuY family protein [Bacteroidales bacterium]